MEMHNGRVPGIMCSNACAGGKYVYDHGLVDRIKSYPLVETLAGSIQDAELKRDEGSVYRGHGEKPSHPGRLRISGRRKEIPGCRNQRGNPSAIIMWTGGLSGFEH